MDPSAHDPETLPVFAHPRLNAIARHIGTFFDATLQGKNANTAQDKAFGAIQQTLGMGFKAHEGPKPSAIHTPAHGELKKRKSYKNIQNRFHKGNEDGPPQR